MFVKEKIITFVIALSSLVLRKSLNVVRAYTLMCANDVRNYVK